MSNYRVASLFAGIGGICLGFKQSGFNIVWANELDLNACKTYRHNFGNDYLIEGDIREISADSLPDFDVLAAGFPCQPFSIAGKQRGFNDERGNLFFEIARIADKRRPRVIFLENVANLIEHDNERTFLVIHSILSGLGYIIRYSILPANEYGNVPQTRNRIYIVAFKNLLDSDRFAFPKSVELTTRVSDIIDINDKKHQIYYYNQNDSIYPQLINVINEKGRIYNMHNGAVRKTRYPLCPTLVASMGTRKNRVPVVQDNYGYRKLTLRECLDFQGFPNTFRFPQSITINDAYKQIGNSVCLPLIKRIAKTIFEILEMDDNG